MIAPRYGVASLADVLPSVGAGMGVGGFSDVLGLPGAQRVVVLLVDGLGLELLRANAASAPFLAGLIEGGKDLDAGFPTTTPQGLAALGTGLPPGGHGLVGASFEVAEFGGVLSPLHWKEQPNPIATQPEPTVLERLAAAGVVVTSVGPRTFAESGLTRAVLRGGNAAGADSMGERVAEAGIAVRRGSRSLVYVYAGDLDRTGHMHGVDSPHWRAELTHTDLLASQLAQALPSGARLYVTADHGMVDCEPADRIDLDANRWLWEGVRLLAGEPRARHVYARAGAAADVAVAWREGLGERALVLTRDEAVGAGWFGGVDPVLSDRIGDVVAIATGSNLLASPKTDAIVSSLRGQHGSLTAAETSIPLLTVTG